MTEVQALILSGNPSDGPLILAAKAIVGGEQIGWVVQVAAKDGEEPNETMQRAIAQLVASVLDNPGGAAA